MRGILAATALAVILVLPTGSPAQAVGAGDRVAGECAACHQVAAPADPGPQNRMTRKAPPLFYAGNKFRESWLVSWLQDPIRIRPAGDFAIAHVKGSPEGDQIDSASLIDHPVLDAAAAAEVAAYLMTLKPHDALIEAEQYAPGNVSPRMGAMDFVKFKGCGGCHRDTPQDGGVSGPELHTAWQRLQPEFIISYIRNPTGWEANSMMPVKHLQDNQIHKLADYLKVIGEQKETAQ